MPVPSTMIELRLTMVGVADGRVTSQQAFIIGIGPMATTSTTFFSAASTSASAAELRVDGRDAESAADEHDGAFEFADVAGEAEGSDEVEDGVALAEAHHLIGGFSNGLDDDGDGAGVDVEIGDGERNAFAMLVDTSHDEVTGTSGTRHVGRLDVPKKGRRTELFPTSDEKHNTP